MRAQIHKVFRVWVQDRIGGELCKYLIEAKGQGARAEKKALKLARDDGMTDPVCRGVAWVNNTLGIDV